jgi:hypothetical protein
MSMQDFRLLSIAVSQQAILMRKKYGIQGLIKDLKMLLLNSVVMILLQVGKVSGSAHLNPLLRSSPLDVVELLQ